MIMIADASPTNVKVYISRLDELGRPRRRFLGSPPEMSSRTRRLTLATLSVLRPAASFLPLYQPKAPVPPKPTLRAPINLNAPQPPPRPPAEPRLRKKPSQSADAPAPPGGQEGGGGGFLNGWFGGGRK